MKEHRASFWQSKFLEVGRRRPGAAAAVTAVSGW